MQLCFTERDLGLQIDGPMECELQQVDIPNCESLRGDHGEGLLLKNTLLHFSHYASISLNHLRASVSQRSTEYFKSKVM